MTIQRQSYRPPRTQLWRRLMSPLLLGLVLLTMEISVFAQTTEPSTPARVTHNTVKIDGVDVFYREAGPKDAPVLLLLHGFPTSSHMYRNLIPQLADKYHVIAPDYPGFGQSGMPDRSKFAYTFDNYAQVVDRLIRQLGVNRYALYVMDYGAPVGFRLAAKNPERVLALIVQNGNAYDEGLEKFWDPIKAYWGTGGSTEREAIRWLTSLAATKWQYMNGVKDASLVSPIHGPWTKHSSTDRGTRRFSSTYSTTIARISRCTPSGRPISVNTSRRRWSYGARTTPSSWQPVPRLTNATFRTRTSISLIPDTSPWRRTGTRSRS